MNEQITSKPKKMTFSMAISSSGFQTVINNTIRDPQRAQRFVAAITSAVAVNSNLRDCDPSTILSGALLGESLGLSPSPQLGQYYLVPFKDNKSGTVKAQFQIGYRGLIQLALRSGYYKSLNVFAVKAGELKKWNPVTEELVLDIIEDDVTREMTETVGYVATFTYLNGFTKTLYWSKKKMETHAKRYSRPYASGKTDSFWFKDFDAMAFKTMLRQLISKWGIMSVDMMKAFDEDVVEAEPDALTMADPVPQIAPVTETPEIPEDIVDADPRPELLESPPRQRAVRNVKKAQQKIEENIEEELTLDDL